MRLRQQFLTRNDCYRQHRPMRPKGVMVHSTGANNPKIARYVPGDAVIGTNSTGNHWDQSNEEWRSRFGTPLNKCVHAFIGQFADGEVGTVQTLPWEVEGWHAGGSANQSYLGFEICEDGLEDGNYFRKVYREAVELTAHLCDRFGLEPLEKDVVLCHAEGYARGIASNHGDVLHWFSKFGKTMDDFRNDVAEALERQREENGIDRAFARLRAQWQDNDQSDWSRKATTWAVEQGLFSGTPGPDGEPNYMWQDLVTREQLAVILYKLAGS